MKKETDRDRRRKDKELERLKSLPPEYWVAALDELEPVTRNQVANIVWWDFFGYKMQSECCSHLDNFIKLRTPIVAPVEELFAALVQCGYTERIARIRLNMNSKGRKDKKGY